MKNLFILSFILLSNFVVSQEKNDLKISLLEVLYNPNKFGGAKDKYGSDIKNPEILYDIIFNIKIEGFDIDNPIDFNNFSLVELDLKLRQRPFFAGFDNFSSWAVRKVNLEDFKGEDTFLKYSIDSITNYDHYYNEEFFFNKTHQQRFCLLQIEAKKNKDKEFLLRFPVKSKDNGNFSLYYKNILVKTFQLKRGKRLKF
jgi:hypothetical protein